MSSKTSLHRAEYEEEVVHDLLGSFRGLASGNGRWDTAIPELVDNAMDKGARLITITMDRVGKSFSIDDDGSGCDRLSLFFGLGQRKNTKDTNIGMHGWGAKHGLLCIAADVNCNVRIESRYGNTVYSTMTTFVQVAERRSVPIVTEPASDQSRTGTRIRLSNIKKQFPATRDDVARLMSYLGFLYSAFVESPNRTIIVTEVSRGEKKTHQISPYAPPKFSHEVAEEFAIDDKRSVRMRVGVVPQGEDNRRGGLHYRKGYRIVLRQTDRGCGVGYAIDRIFGYVDLIGDWQLSTLKNEIYEPGSLYGEVFKRIEPLLKLAQAQLQVIESAALSAAVNARVSAEVDKIKEAKARRRGKGKKVGTQLPTGEGTSHGDAAEKQPGKTMPWDKQKPAHHNGSGGSMSVAYANLDGTALGDMIGATTIRLNTSVDGVRRARASKNVELLFQCAMTVYFLRNPPSPLIEAVSCDEILKNIGRSMNDDAGSKLDGVAIAGEQVA